MATASWAAEAWLALTGALRLARGDARGLAYFDASEIGFWHSFRAGALCYPLYLILLAFPIELGTPAETDPVRLVLVESIHYVISWVAFPLLMLPLVDRLQRGDRYFGFMVAYNWCQVPQTVVFALVALVGAVGLLSAPLPARWGRRRGGRALRARSRRLGGSTGRARPASACRPYCGPDGGGTSAPASRCEFPRRRGTRRARPAS
jgi:hypothetical protein